MPDGYVKTVPMRRGNLSLLSAAALAIVFSLLHARGGLLQAQTQTSVALTGQVRSAEEGLMEGVLVSARKGGATFTVTVVSDLQGRYRFPAAKVEPGLYSLSIRAVGYDLGSPGAVTISPQRTATADLTLRKTRDLASQLTNAEWAASIPGTEQQKNTFVNCGDCHSVERIVRSRFDANAWETVLDRMSSYASNAFPPMPQKRPAPRQGGGENPLDQRLEARRRQAEFLASINLSSTPEWKYDLKTFPRPKGLATQVIYTEYDLPARTRQPHDAILDSQGTVWYGSFGEQILGKLDPGTGKTTEYKVPLVRPGFPTGSLAVRFDEDENIWLANMFQGAIQKFDRKTETFQTWSLPPDMLRDWSQLTEVSPNHHKVDGKVWIVESGTYTLLRLDTASGRFESFEPYPIPRPNVYDVMSDAQNNAYFTVIGRERIGRIDAKTGKITFYQTPTPNSAPRRGMLDSQGRIWFGENRVNQVGTFATRTERFQEWPVPTPYSQPYDATVDKNGEVWTGGEWTDRVIRLNPTTGQFVEYLLPTSTNIRRVIVDNATTPVTFWVGDDLGASIVKLEPLDLTAKTESR